jgi:hypothetical protein
VEIGKIAGGTPAPQHTIIIRLCGPIILKFW